MTDGDMWDMAVAALRAEFAALSPARRDVVAALAEEVKASKWELHAIAEGVCAGEICASCGGECCLTGKFHVTVIDLLVYMVEGRELFAPAFGRGGCPYLGERGCVMAASLRPFNCITFNCERVERLLGPGDRDLFLLHEKRLRALYRRFEDEFGNRFMGGVLLNCERDILRDRLPLLRGAPVAGLALGIEQQGDADGCNQRSGSRPH